MTFFNGENHKRLTRKQKEYAKNKEMKKRAQEYIDYMSTLPSFIDVKETKVNLDLINGDINIEEMYDNPYSVNIGDETVLLDYQDISHTPLISQVSNTFVGEVSKLTFNPSVKDLSPSRATFLKKEAANRLAKFFENRIALRKQEILSGKLLQYGFSDPFQDPNTQMQIQQEVDAEIQQETPESIFEFLLTKQSTPKARGAQTILTTLSDSKDVKQETVQGLKYLLASGAQIYYSGTEGNDIKYEAVNPMFFNSVGSFEEEWVQKHRAAKRLMWLHKDDIIQRFAEDLSTEDLNKLDSQYELIGNTSGYFYDWEKNNAMKHQQYVMSREGVVERLKDINLSTREGQEKYKALHVELFPDASVYGGYETKFGIRLTHVVWRDKKILYKVGRIINGKIKYFYVSEEYEQSDLDEEVTKIYVDEVWEAYVIGTYDPIFVRVRALPNQYLDPDNPYNVNLPYTGKKVGTNKGVSKPFVFVNLGKAQQKDFDISIASIKHAMATEMGSVFTLLMELKPDSWSWQDYIDSIRNLHLMPISVSSLMGNPTAAQFLKEINLTRAADLAQKIAVAEMHKKLLYTSMLFNEERIGTISQYAAGINASAAQTASYNQTTYLTQQHVDIVNKSMMQLLNVGASYYLNNPDKAALILDDLSLADLIISGEIGYPYYGIIIADNFQEADVVNTLKSYALPFIQNSQNHLAIMDIIMAKTEAEIRDIMQKESESIKRQMEEQQRIAQEQFQMDQQTKLQIKEIEAQKEIQINASKLENALQRTMIDSQKFALAQDINKDGQSDLLTSTIIKLKADMEMHKDKMRLEEKKLVVSGKN